MRGRRVRVTHLWNTVLSFLVVPGLISLPSQAIIPTAASWKIHDAFQESCLFPPLFLELMLKDAVKSVLTVAPGESLLSITPAEAITLPRLDGIDRSHHTVASVDIYSPSLVTLGGLEMRVEMGSSRHFEGLSVWEKLPVETEGAAAFWIRKMPLNK